MIDSNSSTYKRVGTLNRCLHCHCPRDIDICGSLSVRLRLGKLRGFSSCATERRAKVAWEEEIIVNHPKVLLRELIKCKNKGTEMSPLYIVTYPL